MILRSRVSFIPLQTSGFRDLGLSSKEFRGILFAQGFGQEVHYWVAGGAAAYDSVSCRTQIPSPRVF